MVRVQKAKRASSRIVACCLAAALSLTAARSASAQSADSAWQLRYERARAALVDDRDAEAALEFENLARQAPSAEDRRLALELAAIARSKLRADEHASNVRSGDELSLLYSTAFLYGIGTSAWVALLVKPKSLGAAILPFAALTTAAVGGVAIADDYRPFRRGVPQSIAAGLYLGLGEGILAVGYQHARATRREGSHWQAEGVATMLWSGATVGGVAGGLLAGTGRPTPGRVSFVTSSAVWGGLLASFGAAAIDERDSYRGESAFAVGAIGYNVALAGGLLIAPHTRLSLARVRLIDLGGIGGGLVGAGAYALTAGDPASSRAGFGASAIGMGLGLGVAWWLTEGLAPELELVPDAGAVAGPSLRPGVTLVPGGWVAEVGGVL